MNMGCCASSQTSEGGAPPVESQCQISGSGGLRGGGDAREIMSIDAPQMLTATKSSPPRIESSHDDDKRKMPRLERSNTTHYLRVHEAAMAEIFKKGNGMVGLRNLGNTCYMNACIQSLCQNIGLADYFLGYDWESEVNENNPTGHKGKVARAFGELLSKMWSIEGSPNRKKSNSVAPSEFKNTLSECAPIFAGYDQQDAHEFLTFLLDALHEDLNRCKSKPLVAEVECDGTDQDACAARAWKGYLRRDKSIIVDLFQGQLRSSLECHQCKKLRIKFDSFQFLSVPCLEPSGTNVDLEQCIEEFARTEDLADNLWLCPNCKTRVSASKRLEVWKLPPILVVHLKRFRFDERGRAHKLTHYIDFPITDLDLSPYCRSPQRDVPLYDLFAVIEHRGNAYSGHYVARARNRVNGNWYYYDDSRVTPITNLSNIATEDAYVLFYSRVVLNDDSPLAASHSLGGQQLFAESKSGTVSRALQQVITDDTTTKDRFKQGNAPPHPKRSVSPNPSSAHHNFPPTTGPPLVRRQSISLPHLWPHYQAQPGSLPPLRTSIDSDVRDSLPVINTKVASGGALFGGATPPPPHRPVPIKLTPSAAKDISTATSASSSSTAMSSKFPNTAISNNKKTTATTAHNEAPNIKKLKK